MKINPWRAVFAILSASLLLPALVGAIDGFGWFYANTAITPMNWNPFKAVFAACCAPMGLLFAGIAADRRIWRA